MRRLTLSARPGDPLYASESHSDNFLLKRKRPDLALEGKSGGGRLAEAFLVFVFFPTRRTEIQETSVSSSLHLDEDLFLLFFCLTVLELLSGFMAAL